MDHSEGQKREPKRDAGPEQIGPYTIIAPLAIGEATSVFLAHKRGALGFQRMAAIKRLRAAYAKQPEWTQLLLDEARLSAGVHHANIVDIIDVGTDDGCYLVMEYIEGADLEMLLLRAGRERHARYVVPPIVDALHGLHAIHTAKDALGESLSMVHQSPCARHILIGIDGTARITDLSQVSARGLIPSALRSARLKVSYMAPEQLLSPEQVDARTDVFIVGITLWEALTGERLFEAEVPELTRRAVLERHIPRPSEVGLRPPRCFDAICARALSRKPEQRYESASEMARELRDVALNEALYANSSELGQWVRALAARTLLERRHAIGADAPSIEMPLDLLESDGAQSAATVGVRPTRDIPVSAPSPALDAGSGMVAKPATPVSPPAEIASESSRVARALTVPVAAPPSTPRVPPAHFSAAKATLLGVSPRIASEPAGSQTATPRSAGAGFPGTVAHEPSARGRRVNVNATLPEVVHGAERTAPLSGLGMMSPAPAVAGPRGSTDFGYTASAQAAAAHGYPPHDDSGVGGLRSGTARAVDARGRAARDDSYERRVRPGRYDDSIDSLRPASRGAHIDASDWDELPSGGRSLGILSVVLVGIIVVAGVVGFKQWSREGTDVPATKSAAAPTAAQATPAQVVTPPPVRAVAAKKAEPSGKAAPVDARATTEPAAKAELAAKADSPASATARPTADGGATGSAGTAAADRSEPPWKRRVPTAQPTPAPARVPAAASVRPGTFVPSTAPRRVAERDEPPGLPSNPYE